MSAGLIKRNQRVEYIASHCPSLTGKFGTVVNPGDRDGWIHVQFEGQSFPSKCDPSSLRLVAKVKAKKARKAKPTAFTVAVNAGALTASLRDDQDELVATIWARLGQEIGDVEALAKILAAAPLLVPAVTKLLAAVEIAMDAEGSVFGRHHNDAVDALLEGRHALTIATGKSNA